MDSQQTDTGSDPPLMSTAERSAVYIGVAIVFAGLAPTTWLLEPTIGYLISAGMVLPICYLGVISITSRGRVGVSRSATPVLGLFVAYWIGLVLQFILTGSVSIVPYIVLTPTLVVALFFFAAPIIIKAPRSFLRGFVGAVGALTVLGIVLLILEHTTSASFPWTGNNVFGLPGYRIASIYANPNALGFVTAVASLSALWGVLETRRPTWGMAFVVVFVGLVLTDATMALAAFLAATVTLFVLRAPALGVGFAVLSTVAAVGFLLTEVGLSYLTLIVERGGSERLEFWQVALAHAAETPLVGAGFDHELQTHNSFVAIVLNLGYLVGGVYILAILGAVGVAWRKARTGSPWNEFVLSMLVLLMFQMLTESFTLGGLSTESWLLATFVGVSLLYSADSDVSFPDSLHSRRPNSTGLKQ
ncbi:hypothetical protein C491_17312 [Natronococcus amylolyticus DSM 10524]|uniref:O-antigen polymerase n=1 Tax=Natronococcus amylolyticus DSM 10524 TaxID=1227497 RepID=L9X1M9_9EURY|nr:hypothetical protein [Natronococcus amylolyticus]ELY55492.1 hypothetical protein C491_17312 [Natronococcus amylolyticus DSM 10524]